MADNHISVVSPRDVGASVIYKIKLLFEFAGQGSDLPLRICRGRFSKR
jgi:hypothetical protein